jgi:hypothetical protein
VGRLAEQDVLLAILVRRADVEAAAQTAEVVAAAGRPERQPEQGLEAVGVEGGARDRVLLPATRAQQRRFATATSPVPAIISTGSGAVMP